MLGFDNSTKTRRDDSIEHKFIIVYDKFTKPMAVSLRNNIGKECSCAIWDKKVYEQNEPKISNKNNLIILDEDLIKTNLANPNLKPIQFSEGVLVKHENNTIGIYIDPNADLGNFKEKFMMSWTKYLINIFVIHVIPESGPGIIETIMMYYNDRKKVKFKLLFDAVNKFKVKTLEDFLNGRSMGQG